MAKLLTDTIIKTAKPDATRRLTMFDSYVTGLHIIIYPTGKKAFRFRFDFNNAVKKITLGYYPILTLSEAREKAMELKKQIAKGIDPTAEDEPIKIDTFREVAEKFIAWKETEHERAEQTIRKYRECLKNDLYPELENTDIREVHTQQIVKLIEKINKRSNSLAIKCIELVSMIVKFAIQQGLREPYTQLILQGVIKEKKPIPKQQPTDLQSTIKQIDTYPTFVMRCAIKLQFLCFLRGSEIMAGEWNEFDFENKLWTLPAEKMKMSRPHVVPLTKQSIEILTELKKVNGDKQYIFASARAKHLGRDALSKAFRELDLQIVPHGCRTLFSTWARNNRFAPHVVETQLSHAEANSVAAAYLSKPELLYLDERREMMQKFADYISASTS